MNVENKVQQILKDILEKPQLTSQIVCKKYELTKGQLNYILKKINDSLLELDLPDITRTKNGRFIVNDEIRHYFDTNQEIMNSEFIPKVFTNEERYEYIKLMIISRTDFLSVDHFTDSLKVSRNTVLRDLKEIATQVKQYDLNLVYNRQDGYHFEGDEWNIRMMLFDLISAISSLYNGMELIYHFGSIQKTEAEKIYNQLILIENDLQIKFTDEKLKILPVSFILIIRRIMMHHAIKYNFQINNLELSDTKEYLAVQRITDQFTEISDSERLYLVIILLTTNLSRSDLLSYEKLYGLREALQEMLHNFEQISSIELTNKDKLLDDLVIHMKPAYYRIKYQMNFQNKYLLENKDPQILLLMNFVRIACEPLRRYFNQVIPENELFFIAIFIGSYIKDNHIRQNNMNRPKAIVVCPNGISVSVLLHSTLEQLLPEIDFVDTISIREYQEKQQTYQIDFVFSPVKVATDKKLFVVNNFISDMERKQLRNRVLQEISPNITNNTISATKILDIVRKHAEIIDEKSLYNEVAQLLQPENELLLKKRTYSMMDFINETNIQYFSSDTSWEKIIQQLGRPLIKSQVIKPSYEQAVLNDLHQIQQYSIFNNRMIILHADPIEGANDLGLTYGICNEGILTNDNVRIKNFVFLSSDEKNKNVDIIFELMELANSKNIDKLELSTSPKEAMQVIKEVCDKYWSEKHGN